MLLKKSDPDRSEHWEERIAKRKLENSIRYKAILDKKKMDKLIAIQKAKEERKTELKKINKERYERIQRGIKRMGSSMYQHKKSEKLRFRKAKAGRTPGQQLLKSALGFSTRRRKR